MYLATVALSACGGCHSSLLSSGEPLVKLLAENSLSYSYVLADQPNISPADVALVTGCIRNARDREIAVEVGRTSRKVIAVGSCAVYGGIAGARPVEPPDIRGADLPVLGEVEPIDSVMNVELYVPGCPPLPGLVLEALKSIVEGYFPLHFEGTVCSECSRRGGARKVRAWQEHPAGTDGEECLLKEGILCMGPVTRGGCRAACPVVGTACTGCRGPSDMVLSSQLHSLYTDMVRYVSLSTRSREDRTERDIARLLEYLYLFTRSDPFTRARVKEEVSP